MNAPDRPKRFNIAIVASPTELNKQVSESNIATIVDLLTPLSDKLFLIAGSSPYAGGKMRYIKVKRWRDRDKDFLLLKILNRILTDLKLALNLLKIAKQVDVVLYYIGAKGYLLSMLMIRLLRKKIVVCSFSSMSKLAEVLRKEEIIIGDSAIPSSIMNVLERATFTLSHRIWIESESVRRFSGLHKYKDKTSICRMFYIDANHFLPKRKLRERGNVIGYLGRLDGAKGVLNLVEAIPMIMESHSDVEFVLFGGGSLWHRIDEEIRRNNLRRKVKLAGEIPRIKVVDCLNELKLLILPSYSEGLPNVVQEAMACGTPVLATPVGGVPDLVRDGETGFIMENNSPQCIARSVTRALEYPQLEEIAQNGRKLMEEEYTYEVIVEECRRALDELLKGRNSRVAG